MKTKVKIIKPNKKMKPEYWKIEKVTGDWEVDIALERCERVGFFRHKRKPILNRELQK